jgi:MFS family permease
MAWSHGDSGISFSGMARGFDMQGGSDSVASAFAVSGSRAIAPPLFAFTSALSGASQGFVTVTLGFELANRGFSGPAIAGVVGLRLLPETWRVLVGPVLDLSLSPRLWFLLSALGGALSLALFAIVPLTTSNIVVIGLVSLALGVFSNICIVAQSASIAITTAATVRGRVAGWSQAGNLSGIGVGGGLGLWLASHVGMAASALMIAACCLVCVWPMLVIRTPRAGATLPLSAKGRELGREVLALASTRLGLLTVLAVTLPMGLGAFLGLLSSVAADWHASADLTASTTGVLAGLASVPGCLVGGHLCDRHPPRIVLACAGLACALGEAAMALGPRTPGAFVVFTLLNNVLLGVAYAAVAAVIFIGLKTMGGGTIGALLGSLCNVPLVAVTFLLGAAEAEYGATGMMTIEAGLGIVSALGYGAMAWLWRPRATHRDLRACPVEA